MLFNASRLISKTTESFNPNNRETILNISILFTKSFDA